MTEKTNIITIPPKSTSHYLQRNHPYISTYINVHLLDHTNITAKSNTNGKEALSLHFSLLLFRLSIRPTVLEKQKREREKTFALHYYAERLVCPLLTLMGIKKSVKCKKCHQQYHSLRVGDAT